MLVRISPQLLLRIIRNPIAIRINSGTTPVQIPWTSHGGFVGDQLTLFAPGFDLRDQLRINTVSDFGGPRVCILSA